MSAPVVSAPSNSKGTANSAGRRPSLSQEALAAYESQQLRQQEQERQLKEQQELVADAEAHLLKDGVAAGADGKSQSGSGVLDADGKTKSSDERRLSSGKPKYRLSSDERRLSATSLRLRSDVEMWLTERVPELTGE